MIKLQFDSLYKCNNAAAAEAGGLINNVSSCRCIDFAWSIVGIVWRRTAVVVKVFHSHGSSLPAGRVDVGENKTAAAQPILEMTRAIHAI